MKKYDVTFFVLGIILSIIPIYTFFGWIYVWNMHTGLNYSEKYIVFKSEILFNFFEGHFDRCLTSFVPGVVAGILLLLSLLNSIQHGKGLKNLKLFFLVLTVACTGYALMDLITVPKAYW